MKPIIKSNCRTCGQEFEAKPIYEPSDQDGKPDVFEGYHIYCKGCTSNPYSNVRKEVLDVCALYSDGLLTKEELIQHLDKTKL